ncbi:MAG TPA: dephospho-CoA kinase [Acidobacteriota bacterium]|nr:dephospho-CoA kinase [Acidobacteriota bacterium]
MEHHILTAALTGGIGTGKSVASQVFKELGCYVFYADEEAHVLMEPKKEAWNKIVAHFGRSILNKDKTINRKRLGKIVFSNDRERQFLNSIIHPLVNQIRLKEIEKLKQEKKYNIFISEAALTIEAGFVDYFDKIIVVFCGEEIQINRLMERDRISKSEAKNKISSQLPLKEKKKYADYLIDTSGDIASTVEQTEKVYRNLVMDYLLLKN